MIRTPFLLFRFPGILFAVLLAALILGVATAASPLFLSSASTAAIRQITATSTNVPALSLSTYDTIAEDVADFRDQKLTGAHRADATSWGRRSRPSSAAARP